MHIPMCPPRVTPPPPHLRHRLWPPPAQPGAGCQGWVGVRHGGARRAGVVAPLIPPRGPPRAAGRFPLVSSSPAL